MIPRLFTTDEDGLPTLHIEGSDCSLVAAARERALEVDYESVEDWNGRPADHVKIRAKRQFVTPCFICNPLGIIRAYERIAS